MDVTFESVKKLISKEDRMKDVYAIERAYLDTHPESGYLTDILPLTDFPDYIDYLPKGAIVRKIGIMGYIPNGEPGQYPFVCISEDEYNGFVAKTAEKAEKAIKEVLI